LKASNEKLKRDIAHYQYNAKVLYLSIAQLVTLYSFRCDPLHIIAPDGTNLLNVHAVKLENLLERLLLYVRCRVNQLYRLYICSSFYMIFHRDIFQTLYIIH